MSTTNSTTENRTAVRPRYIELGTDANGAHHLYRTVDETVLVVHDGRVVHREDVADCSVDDWVAFVAADPDAGGYDHDWEHQIYYRDVGDMLAGALEVL